MNANTRSWITYAALIILFAGLLFAAGLLLFQWARSIPADAITVSPDATETQQVNKETLIVGGDDSYPPYSYLEDGIAKGFDNDLMRAVAVVMGVQVEFKLNSWAETKQSLLDGGIDIISGMAYSNSRDAVYDFSNPHSVHYSDVFVKKGTFYKDLEDLQEIIVQQGDISQDFLASSGYSGEVITTENAEEALRLVSTGKYDGALVNTTIGYYYIDHSHLRNLRALNIHMMERNYGFVVSEGNDQLLRRINQALAIVEANGDYARLTNQWFANYQKQSSWNQLRYFIIGLIALGASLALVIFWVWSLRRQVFKRTTELRESEKKYRQVIDSAAEGVYVVVDSKLVYLNPQALAILRINGMPAFPLELRQFIHPDDFDWVVNRYTPEALQDGRTVKVDHRILLQGGEVRWIRSNARSIEWESKTALLGFFADITEAKILEESVKESERRFRLLFTKTPIGLFYFDTNMVITNYNEQLIDILKFTNEEVSSIDLKKIKDKRILPALSAVLKSEEGYYEGRYRPLMSNQNVEPYIRLRTTPIFNENNELQGGIGLVEDITEKVINEARLHDLENRLAKAFQTSTDAILISRMKDGIILDINRGFSEMTGFSREEVIGRSSVDINLWEKTEDRDLFINSIRQTGEVKNFESSFRTKNGMVQTGLMSAGLIEINGEECLISITRDISERKATENVIRESEQRYRSIFQSVPIAIWDQDFLQAYDMLEELRATGIVDLEEYLLEDPEFVWKVLQSISVTDVNEISVRMYEAQSREDLLGSLDRFFDRDSYMGFIKELLAIWDHKRLYENDTLNRTLDGKRMTVHVTVNLPEKREDFSSVLVSIVDITQRKGAEAALRESENRYKSIFNSVPVCIWDEDFSQVFNFLKDLRENGVKDLDLYLRQHPQAVREAASMIRVNEVNDAAVVMYGAKDKADLMQMHERVFTESSYDNFRRELIAFWNKQPKFYGETVNRTLDGRDIIISISTNIPSDSNDYSRVFVSVEDITERKKAEDQVRRQVKHLAALRAVDMAISASIDLPITLRVLINQAVQQLSVDAASILLYDPKVQLLEFAAGSGFTSHAIENTRLKLGESYAGKAALERRMIGASDLATPYSQFTTANLHLEGFTDYIGVPLIAKGSVKGVLELFNRSPLPNDTEWMSLLDSMAGQAAIAIDNATLFDEVQQANIDLRRAYDATIEGWARALELRDGETEGHSARVADLAVKLAEMFKIHGDDLVNVRRGALLHDIGKMGIPDHILLKQGALTQKEWEIMHKHPVYAKQLLTSIEFLKDSIEIPYGHHEKWDGSGYPEGLQGTEIPLAGRIFAVVDCWDALRSDRPYRKAWTDAEAWKYIEKNSGKEYDPAVVVKFHDLLASLNYISMD